MLRLLKHLTWKEWLLLLLAVGVIFASVYLELKLPDYTKELTTLVTTESTDMNAVWLNGGLMLLCALGGMGCSVISSFLFAVIASNFSASLRDKLFNRIMSFSNKEIHQFHTASLITRTTNDVVQMQMLISMGAAMMIRAPIMAVWALLKISSADISWTAATFIAVGAVLVVIIILIILCFPKFKRIQTLTDDLNNAARENITGVRVIRAFNAEDYQNKKYEKVNNDITKVNLFTSRALAVLNPTINLAINGLVIAIYWIGAALINSISIDPALPMDQAQLLYAQRVGHIANMTAFSQYALMVVMAFLMIVGIFIFVPRAMVSGKRINEVLSTESSIVDGEGEGEDANHIIEFKGVDFSYGGDSNYAVSHIDFAINKGETVAFIGSTGCGKTTLMNLLLRFYEVSNGEIKVEGKNIKNMKLSDLRSKIAFAPQKASLFKGSIDKNVTFGSKTIDDKLIDSSLENACCDFVSELDGGRQFEVAQGGSNLSGGQKQRLSIARALYKNSDILIFDDTFSALDFKTDLKVRRNIKKAASDKTVLIVAQRIGTIRDADKIIVMDKGNVVGIGTHEELLNSNPVYKEIALSQLDKEEL